MKTDFISMPDGPAQLWLKPIPKSLREEAIEVLQLRNAGSFLSLAPNHHALYLVFYNLPILRRLGIYEDALLDALVNTRTNNRNWPVDYLKSMVTCADRVRLLAAGSPLPGQGPFTLYRGVSGRGRARRVRSIHWTACLDTACWFAARFSEHGSPAVFWVTAGRSEIRAYVNDRNEQEFIVLLGSQNRPQRVRMLDDELQHRMNRHQDQKERRTLEVQDGFL